MPNTADERLTLIRAKTTRAKQHLHDLKGALEAFLNSNAYEIGTKNDPDAVHYLTRVSETPIEIALIAGDVLQCTRSALDHLVCQLVLVNGGTPTIRTQYPIGELAKDYPGLRGKALKGVADPAKLAIDSTKPYSDNGSDRMLWRLYKLNNIDKHRVLLTVGSAFKSVDLGSLLGNIMKQRFPGFPSVPVRSYRVSPVDKMCPLKVGDVLNRVVAADGHPLQPDEDMKFTFEVALAEPGVSRGDSLYGTLAETLQYVDDLILTFRPFLT